MHNLLFQTNIAKVLFDVDIDEPVKPEKIKPLACFDDSHGSVANFDIH